MELENQVLKAQDDAAAVDNAERQLALQEELFKLGAIAQEVELDRARQELRRGQTAAEAE